MRSLSISSADEPGSVAELAQGRQAPHHDVHLPPALGAGARLSKHGFRVVVEVFYCTLSLPNGVAHTFSPALHRALLPWQVRGGRVHDAAGREGPEADVVLARVPDRPDHEGPLRPLGRQGDGLRVL